SRSRPHGDQVAATVRRPPAGSRTEGRECAGGEPRWNRGAWPVAVGDWVRPALGRIAAIASGDRVRAFPGEPTSCDGAGHRVLRAPKRPSRTSDSAFGRVLKDALPALQRGPHSAEPRL